MQHVALPHASSLMVFITLKIRIGYNYMTCLRRRAENELSPVLRCTIQLKMYNF